MGIKENEEHLEYLYEERKKREVKKCIVWQHELHLNLDGLNDEVYVNM